MDECEPKAETAATLEHLQTSYIQEFGYIPTVLVNAAFVIERNIKTKGLFQIKGDNSTIIASLLTGHRNTKLKGADVHNAADAMKAFLVSMPEPVLPEHTCDGLINASQKDCMSEHVFVLREFRNQSPYSFAILHFVIRLLKKVSEYSVHNSMDVQKLATIFVLDILRPMNLHDTKDISSFLVYSETQELFLSESVQRLPFLITVVYNLIENANMFKMVCSLDCSDTSSQDRRKTRSIVNLRPAAPPQAVRSQVIESKEHLSCMQTCNTSKENKADETPACSKDLVLRSIIKPHKERSLEMDTLTVHSSTSNTEIMTSASSREVRVESIDRSNPTLKDLVLDPEAGEQSNAIISPDKHESTNTAGRKKFKIVASKYILKKATKKDNTQTKPAKKSLKKLIGAGKRKKQKASRSGTKLIGQNEKEELLSCKPVSCATTFQLPENIAAGNIESSDSDDSRIMTNASKHLRILDSKMKSDSKKSKDFVDQENISGLKTSPGVFVDHKIFSDRMTLVPDMCSKTAAAGIAPSHSGRMGLSVQEEGLEMSEICVKYLGYEKGLNNAHHIKSIDINRCTNIALASTDGEINQLVCERNKHSPPVFKLSSDTNGRNGINQSTMTGCGSNTNESLRLLVEGCGMKVKNSLQHKVADCGISSRSSLSMRDNIEKFPEHRADSVDVGISAAGNDEGSRMRTASQVRGTIPSRSNSSNKNNGESEHTIIVTVRNVQRPRTRARLRHHPSHIQKKDSAAAPDCQNGQTCSGVLSQQLSLGTWLLDMSLACISVVCICLWLHILLYYTRGEDWHALQS